MSECPHLNFAAQAQVHRLFHGAAEEVDPVRAAGPADSLSVTLRAWCVECDKAVRFEGPIGVQVGPGAKPSVSMDGTELRAAGHMGENRTPFIGVGFDVT